VCAFRDDVTWHYKVEKIEMERKRQRLTAKEEAEIVSSKGSRSKRGVVKALLFLVTTMMTRVQKTCHFHKTRQSRRQGVNLMRVAVIAKRSKRMPPARNLFLHVVI